MHVTILTMKIPVHTLDLTLTNSRQMSISPAPKIKYLTNKDLLAAIHESKNTYCEFDHVKFSRYDLIVSSLEGVTTEMLEAARAKRLSDTLTEAKKDKKAPPPNLSVDDFPLDEIVVRRMTFEHIPFNVLKFDKAKTPSERHIRCPFPPFKHYVCRNGAWTCVGQSHSRNGEFCITHGKVTNRLGAMWMKLVDRYGHRGNWRGYSYLEEMKAQSLLQLSQVGLQFDESKSLNPFSYYTSVVSTSFLKILTTEKKSQTIRDDLLIMHNHMPSHTRQTEDSMTQRQTMEGPGDTDPTLLGATPTGA